MGSAEFESFFALKCNGVDGDYQCGPGNLCALHGVHADAASADHDDVVSRLHFGSFNCCPDTSGDSASEQAGQLEGNILLDHGDLQLADGQYFGERAQLNECADLLPIEVKSVGAIQGVARHEICIHIAKVGTAVVAKSAFSAGRSREQDDMIPNFGAAHLGPNFDHHAGTFVPSYDGELNGEITGHRVIV